MYMSGYISIFALLVSMISLAISWHFGFRDRANLKTSSVFYPSHPDYDEAHIKVEIVNHGRRPTILTLLGGDFEDGNWSGENIGEVGKGLRLSEHEKYERSIYQRDLLYVGPEGVMNEYINFWFEDTLGNRFEVKNSRELIKKLQKSE